MTGASNHQDSKSTDQGEQQPGPMRRESDRLTEWRLARVEKDLQEYLPGFRTELHAIREQLAVVVKTAADAASIRAEVKECKAEHHEGDVKLWEALKEERTERQAIANALTALSEQHKSIHRPTWALFTAFLVQSAVLTGAIIKLFSSI